MERSKLLTQLSLKNGLVIGIVIIVISLAMYFVDPLMAYTNFWVGILTLIVFLSLMVYAGITIRKEAGGFWTFGEAFKSFLIMALVISALSTAYNALLMGVIDPDLPEKAGTAIDAKTREMLAKFTASEEQLEEAMAKSGSNVDKLKITPKNVLTSFGVMLAMYGVLSLILAAILKKQQPVFIKTEE